jgi:hypothetical protein
MHVAPFLLRTSIPRLSCKQKVHCRVQNNPSSIPTFLWILLWERSYAFQKIDVSLYFLIKSCISCHMFEIKYVDVVYWRYGIKQFAFTCPATSYAQRKWEHQHARYSKYWTQWCYLANTVLLFLIFEDKFLTWTAPKCLRRSSFSSIEKYGGKCRMSKIRVDPISFGLLQNLCSVCRLWLQLL